MAATGGDVNELANLALRTVTRVQPRWDASEVRRKIRAIAGRSGVSAGTITFRVE